MMLPSIDLDDPLFQPQAPSMGVASHSTSAGSHPSGAMLGSQVFAAPERVPDSNVPAAAQFVPGVDMPPPPAQPAEENPQQQQQPVFSIPGPADEGMVPPESAAHSTAHEVCPTSASFACLVESTASTA